MQQANDGADDKNKRLVRRPQKRKVCLYCADKLLASSDIDYKDTSKLKKFITEKGKIHPRRMSGACAKHQREINTAIKRARVMALLPFKAE
ncbi:MAG: 30S ribosomal protein S18 [Clostridiales bacterium]|nr:30S ribosomal protein S18 [Clostridiales bacterium]